MGPTSLAAFSLNEHGLTHHFPVYLMYVCICSIIQALMFTQFCNELTSYIHMYAVCHLQPHVCAHNFCRSAHVCFQAYEGIDVHLYTCTHTSQKYEKLSSEMQPYVRYMRCSCGDHLGDINL